MNSSRCAACKHLRRRCPSDCIFSPYFPSKNPQRFAFVHKIYGASNVGKILQDLPVNLRSKAADTLCYEASCRIEDPVYGVVRELTNLDEQIEKAHCQLARIRAQIAVIQARINSDEVDNFNNPNFFPPLNDVSNSTSLISYDLSAWFD